MAVSNRVWEIPFDGIEAIVQLEDELVITLSTVEKADELVRKCFLTESTPRFSGYACGRAPERNKLTLWGPSGDSNLLDILKNSVGPDPEATPFRYCANGVDPLQ